MNARVGLEIVTSVDALRGRVAEWHSHGSRVAFVPTMGNLHAGHGKLVTEARRRAQRVVVSVFVNPLQFGPNEDYASYPRTPEDDRRLLEGLQVDLLFVPDENLGAWVMEQTGRPMTLWKGSCYVHVEFTHQTISRFRQQYPNAPLVAHPECTRAVRMLADEVCSTEKMVEFCKRSPAKEIIIGTEAGMIHRLRRECPDKIFIPAPTDNCRCNECRFMKMNTLEKLYDCMVNLAPRVELPPEIIQRARLPIERMLEISAKPLENAG